MRARKPGGSRDLVMMAVVLAGGLGTRLRDRVADRPKPMAPVLGHPFLEFVLAGLASQGVDAVVLSIGHLGDQIREHFGSSFEGMHLVYSLETEPLGTGGAVKRSLGMVSETPFLVVNGDTWVPLDVAGMQAAYRSRVIPDLVMTICPVDDVARFGSVCTDGRTIRGTSEKGRSGPGLINAGAYLVGPAVTDRFEALPDSFSWESEILGPWVTEHGAGFVTSQGPFIDIGVPEDYDRADQVLSRQVGGSRPGPRWSTSGSA